jgi:hypothetical protein
MSVLPPTRTSHVSIMDYHSNGSALPRTTPRIRSGALVFKGAGERTEVRSTVCRGWLHRIRVLGTFIRKAIWHHRDRTADSVGGNGYVSRVISLSEKLHTYRQIGLRNWRWKQRLDTGRFVVFALGILGLTIFLVGKVTGAL